jgi:hypothetical protein
MMKSETWEVFRGKAGLESAASVADAVEAVRQMTYARPTERTAAGALEEWRGTCSTKHELLKLLIDERWPELQPLIMHRVYRLTPSIAKRIFGRSAAVLVPAGGVTDVHTYLTVVIDDCRTIVDATTTGTPWDGRSDMTLACGEGIDVEAGPDAKATKDRLIREHCDAGTRDRVIEQLAAIGA